MIVVVTESDLQDPSREARAWLQHHQIRDSSIPTIFYSPGFRCSDVGKYDILLMVLSQMAMSWLPCPQAPNATCHLSDWPRPCY